MRQISYTVLMGDILSTNIRGTQQIKYAAVNVLFRFQWSHLICFDFRNNQFKTIVDFTCVLASRRFVVAMPPGNRSNLFTPSAHNRNEYG